MTGGPTKPSLRVSEIFGPTVQGEGPAVGHVASFIRLSGCPVACSWCDTAYSWDPSRMTSPPRTLNTGRAAVEADRRAGPHGIVVVTGGEPLAQQDGVRALLAEPALAGRRVHLETAGVHVPAGGLLSAFETVVVSPKLAHSGVPLRRRVRDDALAAFAGGDNVWFKFVARDAADLDEAQVLVDRHGMRRVTVMAEGTTGAGVLSTSRRIADDVLRRGWSLTPRWHVLLWEDAPGR